MDLSIVVLAAGQGTRMKSTLSKVLHPIGGKPMLARVIETAKRLSPKQLIIVHSKQAADLKETLNDPSLTFAEQPTQSGTGDALAKALPVIDPNHRVLVLYGDVPLITQETLANLLQQVGTHEMGILTMITDDPTGLGRIVRDNLGAVSRIVEQRDASAQERLIAEVYTGIVVANAKHLRKWLSALTNHNAQQEYYLTDIVQMAVADKVPVKSAHPKANQEVLGVNDRVQQAQLERYWQQQAAQQLQKEGVYILDPARFDLRGTLSCETDVTIDVNVVFQGHNLLHQGCVIGPNCVLIDCEIGEGTRILANSYLEGTKIGKNAVIGPFARLRPGTVLGQAVRVGNFVEVKNSMVGNGSKINHLSYVGDAQIGKQVNIGAGVITCNYDGVNKHQTIIEDDVHIGSDTQLIAPVRVGKGAMIAAGSTLKQDAPALQLTLTHRLEQRSQTWQRKSKDSASDKNESHS